MDHVENRIEDDDYNGGQPETQIEYIRASNMMPGGLTGSVPETIPENQSESDNQAAIKKPKKVHFEILEKSLNFVI